MPKTAAEITADAIATLLSATSAVTNLHPGSVVRSLLDALGAESARLDKEIVDAAQVAQLNAPYAIWDIAPLPAQPSVYQLTFSNATSAAVSVPAGTLVAVPSSLLQWSTGATISVPALSGGTPGTATVTATCQTAGSGTNVPANTITALVSPITGISVTNASGQAVTRGSDAETQTQTQGRLANKVNSIHRGDADAVALGALTANLTDAAGNITEQVVKALSVDLSGGKAVVFVWGSNGVPSSSLITQTQNVVNGYTDQTGPHNGYKAAGVIATVQSAVENTQNVSIQVLPAPGYTLPGITSQVQGAIASFFDAMDIEQGFSLSNFIRAILRVPGASDVVVTVPPGSLPGLPYVATPTVAPTLTAASGSTAFAAGTYEVGYTFTNERGETQLSPTASVTLTAGQQIQVSALTPLPLGATAVNYYLSTAAGGTTLAYDANGSGAQIDLTALPASGAASTPSANTCAIHGNLYVLGTVSVTAMPT